MVVVPIAGPGAFFVARAAMAAYGVGGTGGSAGLAIGVSFREGRGEGRVYFLVNNDVCQADGRRISLANLAPESHWRCTWTDWAPLGTAAWELRTPTERRAAGSTPVGHGVSTPPSTAKVTIAPERVTCTVRDGGGIG